MLRRPLVSNAPLVKLASIAGNAGSRNERSVGWNVKRGVDPTVAAPTVELIVERIADRNTLRNAHRNAPRNAVRGALRNVARTEVVIAAATAAQAASRHDVICLR